ncbi:arogenate dehydrogenase 1, chloroplastic-like isoform X1 [Vigna umbellata]|uniref:arogenate dehydrogenase 1, chloroplastic-like isoform X1 n=1 Tax=Vigna umbellata TaxID=87088 RepID=UPI001F5F9C81|nr:arogenate dehydrogenase 1, chloroplastic-like isoform X1 [Vigna umbellata]
MVAVSTFQASSSLKPSTSLPSTTTRRNLKPNALPFSSSSAFSSRVRVHRPLRIRAIDAAQPFDYESRVAQQFHDAQRLKIAIVGFGNFGQFLARTLVRQGHTVLAHSRSDYTDEARKLGVTFFHNPHDLCEEHPEVILLCSSIISTQLVLHTLPLHSLKRSTLFVDVLSVKEFPKNLLLHALPSDFDILCTHPMFGPQSAPRAWTGLPFVFEKVRIGDDNSRIERCEKFLNIFAREGCRMVEMCCADHDMFAAESQFITHTVGRVLEMLMLESTPINTKGYETLINLVENTAGDSFDLYYGLFMFNKNSLEMLERLDFAFEDLRKQLMGRLHGVVREQLFDNAGIGKGHSLPDDYGYKLLKKGQNGSVPTLSLPSKEHRSDDVAKLDKCQTNYSSQSADNSMNALNGFAPVLSLISKELRSGDVTELNKFKPNISSQSEGSAKLKIAIIGFGNFGQFLAKAIVRHGHQVLAYSRSDYSHVAEEMGASYFNNVDDLFEQHPEVILLCTSILSTEKVLKSLPVQRLKRNTLFVDVLSVKEFPRNLFLQHLSHDFDILCTHPMFGPESGKNGWNGLAFVYDKVRIGADESRTSRCDLFLDIFSSEGCRMVEMSCAEHDWHAAGSQFITHTTGRFLEKLTLEATPIDTKGYETLLSLVENTAGDSFDLYYGLFLYNANAMEQLERFDLAFESLKKRLFDRMHGFYRQQVFKHEENLHNVTERRMLPKGSEEK